MLPNKAIKLIREYSKPLTRPNWRGSKPIISPYKLYMASHFKYTPLMFNLLLNVVETEWYYLYMNVNYNGLNNVFKRYDIKLESLLLIDGIKEALIHYNKTHYV
jgi:hypothetical protein